VTGKEDQELLSFLSTESAILLISLSSRGKKRSTLVLGLTKGRRAPFRFTGRTPSFLLRVTFRESHPENLIRELTNLCTYEKVCRTRVVVLRIHKDLVRKDSTEAASSTDEPKRARGTLRLE